MPKYLIKAAYNAAGTKGLVKDGGSARRKAVTEVVESLGGKVETFYFAYGADDAITIVEVPDQAAALALSLAVNASGAVRASTVPLISVDEMDAAAKKSVAYRPPGS